MTGRDVTSAPTAPSLLGRIAARLGLVSVLSAVIAYGFLFAEFSVIVTGLRQSTLYSEAEEIARHLSMEPDGVVLLTLPPDLADLYGDGVHRFAVLDHDGRRLVTSRQPPHEVTPERLARPGTILVGFEDLVGVYERPVAESGHYRYGALVEEEVGDTVLTVQVERTTAHYTLLADTLLDEFFNDGGWLGLPFLAVMTLASLATVVQSLAPLRRVSERARGIGPANPGARLPLDDVPREVVPLVDAVNGAVARLEQAFAMQRDFAASAAHELRTPLAVLKARLDTATLAAEDRVALDRDVAVMSRIVDQLFKVVQLENLVVGADERADLGLVAAEVGAALAPLAVAKGIDLSVETTAGAESASLIVRGEPESLFNVLRNLVENAVFHAPAGSAVGIVLHVPDPHAGTGASVAVVDHGPGIPAHHRARVFDRFWQGRRRGGGAGLGLFIVARTMAEHGGFVTVEDTPGGGATFVLRFPPVPR